MTIDVLSLGSFPPATNDELARRFAVTHHVHQPAPQDLSGELRGAHPGDRHRGQSRREPRADRGAAESRSDRRVRRRHRRGRSRCGARAPHPGDQHAGRPDRRMRRPRHRPDAGLGAADRCSPTAMCATAHGPPRGRSRWGAASAARPWAWSASAASAAPSRIAAPPSACASSITGRAASRTRPTSTSPTSSRWRGRATT